MDVIFASHDEERHTQCASALQAALPALRVRRWEKGKPPTGAKVAVVWRPPAELLIQEPDIELVFNLGAGVDALFSLPGLHEGIQIVRIEDAGMAVQMAEYAIHFLLRASRGFDIYAQQQRDAIWGAQADIDRAAWPVGVLGIGIMGARVAQAIAALDYPVAGWSRRGQPLSGVEVYGGLACLPAFLARTRVLINALPLTPQTEGILCHETLSQLIPEAYLINIGRGGHLVEDDLLAGLASGQMRGAALDVFSQEPLPAGHPFWSHPQISVTPHIAAASLLDKTVNQIVHKIQAYVRGEPLAGVVDQRLLY
ncbi:glyoxylate/hydroxypyruvate reductase A [Alcaligenaceae bacterium CGII-47]|nr:glyoxylate/hydroxypyruvate reductase A [Alcaligenaceae bacterium CGII-47]